MLADKVIWSEGILLSQIHLQAWEKYIHSQWLGILQTTDNEFWGFEELEFDQEKLALGKLVVAKCRVIFPQGLVFQYRQSHDAMLVIDLKLEEASAKVIYLSLFLSDRAEGIAGYPQTVASNVSWQVYYREQPDQFDHERRREIALAKPKLWLSDQKLMTADLIQLPMAKIEKRHQTYHLVTQFIPPIRHIKSSDYLLVELENLLSVIRHCLTQLQQYFSTQCHGQNMMKRMEIESLLNGKNLVILYGILQQYAHRKIVHPRELFQVLVQLNYSLLAMDCITEKIHHEYEHDNLSASFSALFKQLQHLLLSMPKLNRPNILFKQQSNNLFETDKITQELLVSKRLVLAIQLGDAITSWGDAVKSLVKVGPSSAMQRLISSAVPGITLLPVTTIPSELTAKPGFYYFYFLQQGDLWDGVLSEQRISVFFPQRIKPIALEIYAIEVLS